MLAIFVFIDLTKPTISSEIIIKPIRAGLAFYTQSLEMNPENGNQNSREINP
jgi:hypothetical protein